MPVEAKPLFRPDLIRPHIDQFVLPDHVERFRDKLKNWKELLKSGRGDKLKETELLPDFLTDFFYDLLGYSGPASSEDHYTISREQLVKVDGKFADAVIGRFGTKPPEFVAALEGKGPTDPLERPYAGRKMSAVDQCYRYAINLPCDWVIVTSIRQTRLYYKGTDQQTYERFDTISLAEDDDWQLKRFLFLLGAERVIPESGRCHLYDLRTASERIGKELTKDYYVKYADIRQDVFEQLAQSNDSIDRHTVLSVSQKLLDRVLFVAFCEDRGLLPADSLKKAYEHKDPYHPRPVWENFRGLFRSIDEGNPSLGIPHYNGGLFAPDQQIDNLNVPDAVCNHFRDIGEFDYRPASEVAINSADPGGLSLIDVDILGHIFEQSISDLEKLRDAVDGMTQKQSANERTRRRREGAFYTPAFITRYIVSETLGTVLADRFERLRLQQSKKATGTARKCLDDPAVYDLDALNNPQREALIRFWEAWQDELSSVRVLDPSCGSGAFLIEAFDQLHATYLESNDRLAELRGERTLFDLDRKILQDNLYGVDLNEEAIEICRLSLWIKTAARGKVLTSLDHTIRVGNSIVADPAIDSRAFDWQAAFPEVFADGGFDAVVGNPPYVRQELLSDIKPYLEQNFASYDGVADLYTYFYEIGMRVLRPGGRLSFIVTNKWMRAGYGKPLRQYFSEQAWMESVVDFGHAKQIFEQADVFPSIIVARHPNTDPAPESVRVCAIPREQLRIDDLSEQIRTEGVEVPRRRLQADAWSLEPPAVEEILSRMEKENSSLSEFTKTEPLSGTKTGFNPAYLIDDATRNRLIESHPSGASLVRPYVAAREIQRWSTEAHHQWMIVMKSSNDFDWPWANEESHDAAERIFSECYPSIHAHLKSFEEQLRKRNDQGRFWWELRSCSYWDKFEQDKIIYPEITWRSQWSLNRTGVYCNNTAYILPSYDPWIVAVMNSPIMWAYSWRRAVHGKDEALRFVRTFVRTVPIPDPTDDSRIAAEGNVSRLVEIQDQNNRTISSVVDWLRIEFEVAKPTNNLLAPLLLNTDEFVQEVRKCRGRGKVLSATGLRSLRDEYERTIEPAKELAREAMTIEWQLSDLVNAAYGLTPDEIDLMWKTAPPRMPIPRPSAE